MVLEQLLKPLVHTFDFTVFTERIVTSPPAWLAVEELQPWLHRYLPIRNRDFVRRLRDFDAVVIHASFSYMWEAKRARLPVLVLSYGNLPLRYRSTAATWIEGLLTAWPYWAAYRRADVVLSCSRYVQQWLKTKYNVASEILFLGVDSEKFSPQPCERENAFVYAGELSSRKGLPALLRGFRTFRKVHPSFRLWLIGFGPMREALSKLAHEGIDVLGYVSDEELVSRYRTARAMVSATYWEGFGLPLLEARSVGTPIVVRHAYSMIELGALLGGTTFFERDDEISDALERVLNFDIRRLERESAALASRFSWSKCSARFAERLTKLIASS